MAYATIFAVGVLFGSLATLMLVTLLDGGDE